MFLHLAHLDDYDTALLIADESDDNGTLLELLGDDLISRDDLRAVTPFETAIGRAEERLDASRRCEKLFYFALSKQLDEHIQFALVHTFEPDGFFEALTDNALKQNNKRAAFEWLMAWAKNCNDDDEQERLYLRALELALHQCEDVQLARRVLGIHVEDQFMSIKLFSSILPSKITSKRSMSWNERLISPVTQNLFNRG